MQCFGVPFKPYCSKMAKSDGYSNTTLDLPLEDERLIF